MADPNNGQIIAAAWPKLVTDKPEDQIWYDRWLLTEWTTKNGGLKKVSGGGPHIVGSIEVASNTTFRSVSDMEALDVQRIDVFDEFEYDWKEHAGTLTYSVIQDWKASGDTKFDLIAGLVQNAINSHKDDIAEAMYGAGTGNDILGLQNLVADAPSGSVVVGGINQATFTFWRNYQATGAQSSAAYDNMISAMRTAYNTVSFGVAGDHPTVGVTTQTLFEVFESKVDTKNSIYDGDEMKSGYKNETARYKGMRLSYDADCTAGHMYFLNPKYLKLYVSSKHWMALGKELEPVNQNIRVRKVYSILAFIATQRRKLGVLSGIT